MEVSRGPSVLAILILANCLTYLITLPERNARVDFPWLPILQLQGIYK
jgi:hypothetical protein